MEEKSPDEFAGPTKWIILYNLGRFGHDDFSHFSDHTPCTGSRYANNLDRRQSKNHPRHPCGTAMMAIDVKAKTVAVVVSEHKDLKFCSDKPEGTWSLVDGFPVGWNIARDKQRKALELVYEPSRKLIRVLEPIKPALPIERPTTISSFASHSQSRQALDPGKRWPLMSSHTQSWLLLSSPETTHCPRAVFAAAYSNLK